MVSQVGCDRVVPLRRGNWVYGLPQSFKVKSGTLSLSLIISALAISTFALNLLDCGAEEPVPTIKAARNFSRLTIKPASLSFKTLSFPGGPGFEDLPVTITNSGTGTTNLVVKIGSPAGGQANAFLTIPDASTLPPLAPGGTTQVTVRFRPGQPSSSVASIAFTSNATSGASAQTLAVHGSAKGAVGNSLPPSVGQGDVESFFPIDVGDAWFYNSTTAHGQGFDSVRVTGQKSVDGQSAAVLMDTVFEEASSPIEAYYYKNEGGLVLLGNNDPLDTLTAGIVPYIETFFPVATGTVSKFSKSRVDTGIDVDGDGINETGDFVATVNVADFEPIEVAVGSFPRTARIVQSLVGKLKLSSRPLWLPATFTRTMWLAPGVGIVKQLVSQTIKNQNIQESFEARGYVVGDIQRGSSAPFIVTDNVAPPTFNPGLFGRPSLASDGTNFIAINNTPDGMAGNIFDAAGNGVATIDFGVQPLATGNFSATAFDGSNYLVAIPTHKPGGSDTETVLSAHRVTPAGIDLDAPSGLTLLTPDSECEEPAAAAGSTNTLVVYSRFDNNTEQHLLYGLLVDKAGQLSKAGEISIAVDSTTHLYPSVAFDGTNYLVVWQQMPTDAADPSLVDIYGTFVSPTGVVQGSPFAISSALNGQFTPSVAFDGTNYLAVWDDSRNMPAGSFNATYDVYGTRLTPEGVLLDGPASTGALAISLGGTQLPFDPFVGFDGSEYLVTWSDVSLVANGGEGVRVARVSKAGRLVATPPDGIAVSGPLPGGSNLSFALPVMASNSSVTALVWLDLNEPFGLPSDRAAGMMIYSF
jgi:hypothetical protein